MSLNRLALASRLSCPRGRRRPLFHRFARFIADDMFLEDTQGRYIHAYDHASGSTKTRRYLPVNIAMRAYGIGSGFMVPESYGREVREDNVIRWDESGQAADSCYDYTLDLQYTTDYDCLLAQMADEVFHTIFPNRVLLSRIHEVLASYVRDQDAEGTAGSVFPGSGPLRRVRQRPYWSHRPAAGRPVRPRHPPGPRRSQRRIQSPAAVPALQRQESSRPDRTEHTPSPLLLVT